MILHTPCHSVPSLIYCKSQGRPSLQGNAWMGTTLQQLFQNAWLDPQLTATILIPCQPMQHWLLCNYGLWIHFHLFRSSVNKEPLYRQFCFSESLRHYLFILIHLNTNLSISRSGVSSEIVVEMQHVLKRPPRSRSTKDLITNICAFNVPYICTLKYLCLHQSNRMILAYVSCFCC